MKNNYIKLLEKTLELNKIIQASVPECNLLLSNMDDKVNPYYWHLYHIVTKKDEYGISFNIPIDELVTKAKRLAESQFVEINKILYIDLFNRDVYIDKVTKDRIASIKDADTILLKNNGEIKVSRLWIMEPEIKTIP